MSNFTNAAVKSIRSFYAGELPKEAISSSKGEFKYTLDYFDDMKDEKPEKSKAKKKTVDVEEEEMEDE